MESCCEVLLYNSSTFRGFFLAYNISTYYVIYNFLMQKSYLFLPVSCMTDCIYTVYVYVYNYFII